MSTIAQQLEALATIKEAIRQAIIAKGVTVASDAAFDTYATAIGQISGGGGSAEDTLKGVLDRSITSITVPSGLTELGNYACAQCALLTSVTIPDSVVTVGQYAFNGCTGLTTVEIGSGCTTLSSYAFNNCKAVTTIICKAASPPSTANTTFGSNTTNYVGRNSYQAGTNKLYVPYGKSSAYSSSGYFASVLLDSTKSGFTVYELDQNGNIPT